LDAPSVKKTTLAGGRLLPRQKAQASNASSLAFFASIL
jgi:hypothetical protein